MKYKALSWSAAAVAFVVAAQIGSTPTRSDDVRVAVLSDCPVAKGSIESGAALAEAAIALGNAPAAAAVTAAAQVAKAYGQPHVSPPLDGTTAEHFYVTDGQGKLFVNAQRWRCLVVMVKDLRQSTAAAAPADAPASAAGAATDDYAGYRLYFEAVIAHTPDRAAFELKPVTLRFRQAAEPSWLGSSARDLALSVRFAKPGAKEPFAVAVFDFKSLVPAANAEWRDEALGARFAKRSGWLPSPALDESIKSALSTPPATPPQKALLGPTNISVSVVEARDGSLLWRLLGGVLESVAPTLKPAPAPPA
jgi:hypothetical protein